MLTVYPANAQPHLPPIGSFAVSSLVLWIFRIIKSYNVTLKKKINELLQCVTMPRTSNSHVSEEEPAWDERFAGVPGWFVHDVQIRGVESKSRCRETVCYQVDPEKLYWNERFRHTKGSSQEDTNHLQVTSTRSKSPSKTQTPNRVKRLAFI